jgi:hypothetical protein
MKNPSNLRYTTLCVLSYRTTDSLVWGLADDPID